MTIIKGSDGSWTWNGGKEGAQRFDELAQAEALAKFDELGELCWLQKNPEINEDTWDEYVAGANTAVLAKGEHRHRVPGSLACLRGCEGSLGLRK